MLALAIPIEATAQKAPSSQEIQQAQRRWDEGKAAYSAGNFEAAWLAFKQAYAAYPHPAFLQNLGETELRLSRFADAAHHLSVYLRHPMVTDSERELASQALKKAAEKLGAIILVCKARDAEVSVDKELIGKTPFDGVSWYVEPGPHTVVMRRDGDPDEMQTVKIAVGETKTVRLEPRTAGREVDGTAEPDSVAAGRAAGSGMRAARSSSVVASPGSPSARVIGTKPSASAARSRTPDLDGVSQPTPAIARGPSVLGYVVGGIGAASLAAGVVTRVMALNQRGTIDAECVNRSCSQRGLDALSSAGTLQNASTALFVAGAVGVGAAAWILFVHASDPLPSQRSSGEAHRYWTYRSPIEWVALGPAGVNGGASAVLGGRF